jgi:ComF family protein
MAIGAGKRVFARSWLATGVDIAFPPGCVNCGGLVENSDYRTLCVRCAAKLDFVESPACVTCGHPFYGEVEGERMCPHCEGLHPAYAEGRTTVLFKGPARALIHELKYHRGLYVLADLAEIFRRSLRVMEFVQDAVLVPVPLHPRKHRERGYNQSECLVDALIRATEGRTRSAQLLRRVVDTASQTAFDRKARRTNLKNAFALRSGAPITPGHRYILVDDVFTTGSTLNSCAGVLRRAGCLNLGVLTFGHG